MPKPLIQKKLKLTSSMKTYKLEKKKQKKRCPFHDRGLEWKSRKSRATWSIRQVWPRNTNLNRAKANRVLTREQTGHSKHPFPTTQEVTLHMENTKLSILK